MILIKSGFDRSTAALPWHISGIYSRVPNISSLMKKPDHDFNSPEIENSSVILTQ